MGVVPFSRARPPHLPGKPVPCTCGVPGSPVHTCEQRPGPMGFTSWAGTWELQVRRVRQTKQTGLSSVTRRLEGDVSKATCSGGQSSILHQRERPHRVSDHRGRSCCQGSPSPGPCPAQIQPQQVTSPTPTWHSTPLCVGGGTWPRWPDQAAAQGWHRGQTGGSGTWAQQGPWGGQGRAGHRWENSREPR